MDTENERHATAPATEPEERDFERYASYEEEGSLVICDRENPSAWVKSDVTRDLKV